MLMTIDFKKIACYNVKKDKTRRRLMSSILKAKTDIENGVFDSAFVRLYGEDAVLAQRERYQNAIDSFARLYPKHTEINVFSASGRTEICGNHTDHNFGKTLSAAVDLDVIAVVAKDENKIEIHSEGFSPDILAADDIGFAESEKNTSRALVKGVCNGLVNRGFKYGGFVAYSTSNVLKGSGVSSSAAYEVLLVTIQSELYNDGKIDAVTAAQISQYAENDFFGKPCGLLDQMSSSVGGFLTIDFENPDEPKIHKIDYDFEKAGYTLCIIDAGVNHADLTHEYASIPLEMKAVAGLFGKKVLREVTCEQVIANMAKIRKELGDRAPLRALHFLTENDRVQAAATALENGDFNGFLDAVNKSGRSSFMYLQNVYSSQNVWDQSLSDALCLCDMLLGGKGAFRVHGGGFGGTVQAFVPNEMLSEFKEKVDSVFSKGGCKVLKIRKDGGIAVIR